MASIISHHRNDTFELARSLAEELRPGSVLALVGDLGAGKTSFTQGLAAGLGIEADVSSPTFTLIHEYPEGRIPLYHVDLYRLECEEEALEIGLCEYLEGDGVTVVEWADKFPDLIPETARWVRFRVLEGDQREISL